MFKTLLCHWGRLDAFIHNNLISFLWKNVEILNNWYWILSNQLFFKCTSSLILVELLYYFLLRHLCVWWRRNCFLLFSFWIWSERCLFNSVSCRRTVRHTLKRNELIIIILASLNYLIWLFYIFKFFLRRPSTYSKSLALHPLNPLSLQQARLFFFISALWLGLERCDEQVRYLIVHNFSLFFYQFCRRFCNNNIC